MPKGRVVFSQLMDFFPKYEFDRCVERYQGNRNIRTFSCLDQFLCMAFAQITFRESLRDIEISLRAMQDKLYHVGFRGKVSRSTLADANERRDWRIYADLAQTLIAQARRLYAKEDLGFDLDETVYAFDSTTIDLCLSLFPWAKFRRHKAAIKLHTLLDLRGAIPCFLYVTDGKVHDVNALDELLFESGSYYIMDRGYLDFARLFSITKAGAFFVIRSKKNLSFVRLESSSVDRSIGIRSDQRIRLRVPKSFHAYPDCLRRVASFDKDIGKRVTLLTNQFTLPAEIIALLYKRRWWIELFFKWIKQNLRVKAFYGTSMNAVQTQIWIAVCVYVLLLIAKKNMNLPQNLTEIHTILSISVFHNIPMRQLFTTFKPQEIKTQQYNPLLFMNL